MRAQGGAWIFTSATLAIGEDFSHFLGRIGAPAAQSVRIESPFDFESQAQIYLPNGLPDPASPGYTSHVVEAALPLIEAAGGRSFLLFTSHRALAEAARLLEVRPGFRERYPLLVQGEAPRESLLSRFRELGNAVLLGTASFWEGVDVRGHALALVVIDKLPFAAPEDPLLKARLEGIRRRGGNPFQEFQLPQGRAVAQAGLWPPDPRPRGFRRRDALRSAAADTRLRQSLPRVAPPRTRRDGMRRCDVVPEAQACARGAPAARRARGMKILALDAATEACSAALLVDASLAERFEVIGRGHADRLLPMAG
jgi:hypothetical protein